jgi:hypothetical protein
MQHQRDVFRLRGAGFFGAPLGKSRRKFQREIACACLGDRTSGIARRFATSTAGDDISCPTMSSFAFRSVR